LQVAFGGYILNPQYFFTWLGHNHSTPCTPLSAEHVAGPSCPPHAPPALHTPLLRCTPPPWDYTEQPCVCMQVDFVGYIPNPHYSRSKAPGEARKAATPLQHKRLAMTADKGGLEAARTARIQVRGEGGARTARMQVCVSPEGRRVLNHGQPSATSRFSDMCEFGRDGG
jgi:hypothetical protein